MATPSGVQGLLSALQPWMTGGSSGLLSDQYGGTSGLMDAMLQAGGPDTTFSNMGRALTKQKALALDEAASRQQLAQGDINTRLAAMMLPMNAAYMRQAMGAAGAPGAAPSATSGASSVTPLYDAASQTQQQPSGQQQGVPGFSIPTVNGITGSSLAGLTPQMAIARAFLQKQDPIAAYKAFRDQQYEQARQQYAPELQMLSGVVQSDTPTRDVKANPQLNALWQQYAGARGIDPAKGFTDANVRQVFGTLANQVRAGLSEPTVAPPIPLATSTLADGRTVQTNRLTGQQTILPASPVEKVLGQNGQPINVPLAKSAGMTPYSPFAVTNAQMNGPVGALDAALTQAGVNLPGGRGGQMKLVTLRNLIANNPGKSPEEIADMVRTGQLDFNGAKRSTGQLATISAASNAQMGKLDRDFAAMEPLVAKLPNAPAVINRALAQLSTNWKAGGDKDTAALLTYFREAATEYAKLSSGSTGSAAPAEGQINESLKLFQNAFTQGGYAGMKQAILQSAQNKRDAYAEGLRMAAAPGAGVGESHGNVPTVNAQGWTLHVDKNGNQAYVSPDGKQYEMVKPNG